MVRVVTRALSERPWRLRLTSGQRRAILHAPSPPGSGPGLSRAPARGRAGHNGGRGPPARPTAGPAGSARLVGCREPLRRLLAGVVGVFVLATLVGLVGPVAAADAP